MVRRTKTKKPWPVRLSEGGEAEYAGSGWFVLYQRDETIDRPQTAALSAMELARLAISVRAQERTQEGFAYYMGDDYWVIHAREEGREEQQTVVMTRGDAMAMLASIELPEKQPETLSQLAASAQCF